MRIAATLMLGFALWAPASATLGADERARLVLEISHIPSAEGALRIGVFCDEAAYRALRATRAIVAPVTGTTAQISIQDVPAGRCAVLVHHDRDGDGSLDLGPLGIPSEPTAVSNNARALFGPPSWRRAAFDVRGPESRHGLTFP
jgi:uncharacterized protein (DUF2141 family)